jgi:hypothetical protein
MFKHVLIFFLLASSVRLNAISSDSLKVKPSKHIVDLSYGSVFFIGERSVLYPLQLYSTAYFSSSPIRSSSLNYSYLINSKTKKTSKLLYFGGGITYVFFTIKKELKNNVSKFSTYSYNPDFINYNIKTLGISLHIENVRYFKNLCFTHRLGISYVSVLSKNQEYSYEETIKSSSPYQDPAIASPANPQGWAWNNSTTISIKKDKIDDYPDYLTPFYNVGLGYRIKHIIPYASGEFSLFDLDIKSPTFKIQAGIKLLF